MTLQPAVSQGSGWLALTWEEAVLKLNLDNPPKEPFTIVKDLPKAITSAGALDKPPLLEGFLRREELAHQLNLSPRDLPPEN